MAVRWSPLPLNARVKRKSQFNTHPLTKATPSISQEQHLPQPSHEPLKIGGKPRFVIIEAPDGPL